jgi:hypothetical protein
LRPLPAWVSRHREHSIAGQIWPNASNTGVPPGTTLTKYTGPTQIRTNGTVIEGKDINAKLQVVADDVTIKASRLYANGEYFGIDAQDRSITVTDCEIYNNGFGTAAILGAGTWTRLNIHRFENGVVTSGSGILRDSYIHDLGPSGPNAGEAHVDGISVQGGQDGWLIQHDHIESWDTSGIFIAYNFGPLKNITVDGNRIINTPGKKAAATIHLGTYTKGNITNVIISNNILEKGNWFYVDLTNVTPVWTNNRDYITGASIPAP